MGGVCAFANPEPVAPFVDLVVIGDGEHSKFNWMAYARARLGGPDRGLTVATTHFPWTPDGTSRPFGT